MNLFMNTAKPILFGALALITVLIIDIFSPLGISTGALYLFCFFLVCRENKKVIITFAVITSILAIAKLAIFYSPSTSAYAFYNRTISVGVIIVIALLALKHRKLTETNNEERKLYIYELEKMLFKTTHKVRRPVANCLGLMQLLDTSQPISAKELHDMVSHFKTSAMELDEFTKDLTVFIHDIKTKQEIKSTI